MIIIVHVLGGPLNGTSYTTGKRWFQLSEHTTEAIGGSSRPIYRHKIYLDSSTGEEYYLDLFNRFSQ